MKGSLYLCMAFAFNLAAASFTQENGCCPHKKTTTTTHRTTTLKTTTQQTTQPHTNRTTLHTTVTPTTKHTSILTTLHTTTKHTTANHTSEPHTTATVNHTTANPTSTPHTTATTNHTTVNHTSAPHTTATANHTTANHTSAPHTTATANHTTANHTSAPHTTATANFTTANHTSAPHTTNHTKAPSTTIVPTVNPDITVGEYTVKNGSEICLRAKLGLKLMIRYNISDRQLVWGSVLVPGPNITVPSGNCSDQKATLRLTFPNGFIEFTFYKNVSKQFVYMGKILLKINHTFPHSQERSFEAHNSSLHEFETVLGKSFQCKNLTIDVTSGVALNIIQEQVQAFQLPGGQFGRADHCFMDQPSMAVPIIVGVILAVLIIIVVVAYLIGRKRAHNGYQSI